MFFTICRKYDPITSNKRVDFSGGHQLEWENVEVQYMGTSCIGAAPCGQAL